MNNPEHHEITGEQIGQIILEMVDDPQKYLEGGATYRYGNLFRTIEYDGRTMSYYMFEEGAKSGDAQIVSKFKEITKLRGVYQEAMERENVTPEDVKKYSEILNNVYKNTEKLTYQDIDFVKIFLEKVERMFQFLMEEKGLTADKIRQ